MIKIPDLIGKWILITGDVNAGKTTLTRDIMNELCRGGMAARIVIVDMAPEIPQDMAAKRGLSGIGGKLLPVGWENIIYLAARLQPPRLSSKTEDEALMVAEDNRTRIDDLFRRFQGTGRDILLMNDVSMYLQAGTAKDLLKWTRKALTVIANGYLGQKLGAGILSRREALEMGRLKGSFAYHVRMPGSSLENLLYSDLPE
jgi:hypothetical protein